jgi:drug/metabolite transporter (DMT)-like permease
VYSLYPIAASFAAWAVLKEKISPIVLWALVSTIAGVVLLCRPSFMFDPAHLAAPSELRGHPLRSRTVGIASALASSCFCGLVFVCNRIAKAASTYHFMLSHCAATAVVALLALALPGEGLSLPPSGRDAAFQLGQAFLATAAHFCMTVGSKRLPSALASILTTSEILWAYCLQVAAFHVTPDPIAAAGAALVVVSLLLIIAGKSQPPPPAEQNTAGAAAACGVAGGTGTGVELSTTAAL